MAFCGFMRCGEFTCNSSHLNDYLRMSDVTIDNDRRWFVIHLIKSKCDPYGKGVNVKIFENCTLFPVKNMSDYVLLRRQTGAKCSSPLFLETKFIDVPLSRSSFIFYLKELLTKLNYDETLYSGHSFRTGAATSAADVEDHIIQALGRWNSNCYFRYIRTDQNIVELAQSDMCIS